MVAEAAAQSDPDGIISAAASALHRSLCAECGHGAVAFVVLYGDGGEEQQKSEPGASAAESSAAAQSSSSACAIGSSTEEHQLPAPPPSKPRRPPLIHVAASSEECATSLCDLYTRLAPGALDSPVDASRGGRGASADKRRGSLDCYSLEEEGDEAPVGEGFVPGEDTSRVSLCHLAKLSGHINTVRRAANRLLPIALFLFQKQWRVLQWLHGH